MQSKIPRSISFIFGLNHIFADFTSQNRAVGTRWRGMAAAIPIFKVFTTICHSLPYQYLRDYKGLPYQYFRPSATPVSCLLLKRML